MSAQHTPGPWRYEAAGEQRADNDMRHGVVAECNDLWVAACYRSGTSAPNEKSSQAEAEAEANARLIAAAPDLLAASQQAMLAFTFNGKTAQGRALHQDALRKIRAAIARAEGRT